MGFRNDKVGANPEEWQGSVISNLSHADTTHHETKSQIAGSIEAIRRTNAEQAKMKDSVHGQFVQKIRNTEELRQQLATRIRSNKNTLEHTEWSLSKVKAASDALIGPLDLCRQRLALRQKRPKREIVFDAFQQSLLHEEKELQMAKARLADCAADMQALIVQERQLAVDLEADLRDKKHALNIDHRCVAKKLMDNDAKLDKSYHRKNQGQIAVFPEIMSTPRDGLGSVEPEGRSSERQRQKLTLRTIEHSLRLEQSAKERWQATTDALEITRKSTEAAFRQTQADMGKKIEHTELLKQELLKQRNITGQHYVDLNKCLTVTMDKHYQLDKPMNASMQRTKIRGLRTPRESFTDQVSEALTTQQHTLEAKRIQLEDQIVRMRGVGEELQHTCGQLEEDIKDKEKALNIDRACASCKNTAHGCMSYGFSKVGQGQRHFSDTASSMLRQVPT